MLCSPAFIWWLWLSVTLHHGQPFVPLAVAAVAEAWRFSAVHAAPSLAALAFHVAYTGYQWALAQWLPGPVVYGAPVDVEDPAGERHAYICNAPFAWYTTLALAAVLHVSGAFDLVWIIDQFGPLIILLSVAASIALYAWAAAHAPPADAAAATGSAAYDTFMGLLLHPRIGAVHLKMLFDVRLPWPLLFLVSLSAALAQRRALGHFTPELLFMVLAHFLYANATHKGEEHVPCTWDITQERFGFMLLFWNAAGIPFGYSATSIYLLHRGPLRQHWAFTAAVYVLMLLAYYVWDTANCQKSVFKAQEAGRWEPDRWRAPPQLPWSILREPETIGGRLLVSGWWAHARKVTYTADLAMALSWGLITGAGSVLPYWYFAFFLVVLLHRVSRNERYCSQKYGPLWEEYCARVPYCFIPGII
eukprot:jgi/Ulvmu1/2439/UM134_0021.1